MNISLHLYHLRDHFESHDSLGQVAHLQNIFNRDLADKPKKEIFNMNKTGGTFIQVKKAHY